MQSHRKTESRNSTVPRAMMYATFNLSPSEAQAEQELTKVALRANTPCPSLRETALDQKSLNQ